MVVDIMFAHGNSRKICGVHDVLYLGCVVFALIV